MRQKFGTTILWNLGIIPKRFDLGYSIFKYERTESDFTTRFHEETRTFQSIYKVKNTIDFNTFREFFRVSLCVFISLFLCACIVVSADSGQQIDTEQQILTGENTNNNFSSGGEDVSFSGSGGETTTFSLENTSSGQTSFPQIIIKEIQPKDTPTLGEYIALLFLRAYSGSIDIVGLGNGSAVKTISVQGVTGEVIYIGDNQEKLSIEPGKKIYLLSSITLTDTGEPLELKIGGMLHDRVMYTTSSSTHVLTCSEVTNSEGYRICDQLVMSSLVVSPNQGDDIPSGFVITGSILSGTTQTGSENTQPISGEVIVPPSPIHTTRPFHITEIYPYNILYPEYIEITASESYNGSITIEGLGQGTASKTVFINTIPGIRWVVTSDRSRFPFTPFVLEVGGVSLTNNGEEVSIYLPSGHEIDSVVYSGQSEVSAALFADSFLSGTLFPRSTLTWQPPTPGYVREMVDSHIPKQTEVPYCGIHRQHSQPFLADKKLNLQAQVGDIYLQNTQTTYTCERLFSGTNDEYLSGCNPSYLSFEPGLHPVFLRITKNNTPYCELSQQLNLPGPPQKTETTQSYYEGLYRKWKEKYELVAKQIREQGYTLSSDGTLKAKQKETSFSLPEELLVTGTGPPLFRIHQVLPNPKGKDSLGELIVIENLTEEEILSDTLLLVRGKTSKGLPSGILLPPKQPVEIQGDIGLPNSPTCIGLRYRNTEMIVSLFCYPQLAEGASFTGGLVGFTGRQEQERLQNLSLQVTNDEVCVDIADHHVLCKELPYVVSDTKQWKKDARKLISTEKKVVTLQEKYDLWREKYATLSKNNKKRETGYLQTNRTLRKDLSIQKQQKELFRGLYRLFFKKIGSQRTPLYELSTTKNIQSLYDNLAFSQESATVSVGPIDMQISEVEAWYDFYFEGKLPESHGENEYIVDYVRNGVRKTKTLFGSLFQ